MRRICGLVFLVWACLSLGVFASGQGNTNRDKDFTFLYLANPVVSADNDPASSRKLFDTALAQEKQPAFFVVNGGLTREGKSEEWTKFRGIIESLPQGFPVYALPSGSDYAHAPISKSEVFQMFYPEGKREIKGRPARGNRVEDRLYQSFDVENVHVVLLDAAIPLEPHNAYAHLDTEQLAWLDKDLKKLKKDTRVLVFLNTSFGSEAISTRPLANEFELWQVLRPQNVIAIFATENNTPNEKNTVVKPLNGTHIVSLPTEMSESQAALAYRVRVTPLRISITQIHADGTKPPAEVASFTPTFSTRKSVLKAAFDDDGNPFLVRRHPIGLFEPRAISDNPENETGEYRIDEGEYQPMKRDARDIWRSPFRAESLPVGIHSATVRVTSESENRTPHSSEIIFEVERDTKEATRRWASNLDNPIVSSSVLSSNTLYVSGTDAKLYALNVLDGKKRTLLTARGGFYASPCLAENTIYIGSLDKTFYAVNAENGSLKWKFETDAPIYATAAVAQDVVCFGGKGKVYGIDTKTGKPVWTKDVPGFYQSAAATDGEAFYLGGWENGLTAFEAKTGTVRWRVTRISPNENDNALPIMSAAVASPIAAGGKVFVCNYLPGASAYAAYETKTGRRVWYGLGGNIEATPAADASELYFAINSLPLSGKAKDQQAFLAATNIATGRTKWSVTLAQPVMCGGVRLSPDGKTLAVVGVRGSVSVHSTQDGKKLWGYELGPGNVFSTPEYDGQTVYTATMANDVQALNAPGYDPKKRTEGKK